MLNIPGNRYMISKLKSLTTDIGQTKEEELCYGQIGDNSIKQLSAGGAWINDSFKLLSSQVDDDHSPSCRWILQTLEEIYNDIMEDILC